ncbi:DUF2267 domain-containing protein [Dactylosporangium matsuzakiense]|uniref:DUF2267 domain-containing protein n=1 Tax=Dactylosporangium matsuzakiense TaxID=53360 RepID=A0A9W6NQZ2_9ACTN|nr:DUF2267 domain-containing protein [Dactylosporangium matsuzakiense]UWZ47683.1 DUF2267 domain-containing protein [Dactylosporangium matsuzakiense]GLL05637.1 hypothetical protein GCM10017581_073840 [Dactylosporangium matsuzakiense]
MDERALSAVVADRAVLAKEEAADLIRATLEEMGKQLSGGELQELAINLPEDLAANLPPRHDGGAHPVPLPSFLRALARRTGLKQEEVTRGVRAVLTTLSQTADGTHLRHALSQLPAEYRELATTAP